MGAYWVQAALPFLYHISRICASEISFSAYASRQKHDKICVHDAAETFETFCYIETALINSYLPLFTTDMITHVGNTYRAFSDA